MSVEAVEEILRRARDDEAFRDQLGRNSDAALQGQVLEPWERAALITGDRDRLVHFGVDPELADLASQYYQEMNQ